MSDEFLEFQFPCKECLVTAICREKPGITGSDKQNLLERDRTHCLTLPYVSKDKHYHKMLIECWANLGQSMFCQVQNVENPVGTNVELQVPINYIFMLELWQILLNI